jgi:hypothetical protein
LGKRTGKHDEGDAGGKHEYETGDGIVEERDICQSVGIVQEVVWKKRN